MKGKIFEETPCTRCGGRTAICHSKKANLPVGLCIKCKSIYLVHQTKKGLVMDKVPFSLDMACPNCGNHSMIQMVDEDTFQPKAVCFFCEETLPFSLEDVTTRSSLLPGRRYDG